METIIIQILAAAMPAFSIGIFVGIAISEWLYK